MDNPILAANFCGVAFLNPFILADSPSTDDREMVARGFDAGWAGAVLKTTSVESKEMSLVYPLLQGIGSGPTMYGLQNIDLLSERHITAMLEDVVWLKQRFPSHRVAISLMGNTRQDWEQLVTDSVQAGVDLIELSISCPQGAALEEDQAADGWMISQDAHLTEKVTRWAVEAAYGTPVFVKISPSVTDIRAIAQAVERGGAQGICAIDSVEGIGGVDLETLSPLPSVQGRGSRGGLTGRAIKPVALRCVADIASVTRLPISGVGGVYDWHDALEHIFLGASTVQVCTAVMHQGFGLVTELCDGLARWMEAKGYHTIEEMVGLGLRRLGEHEELVHGVPVHAQIDKALCIGCALCYVACRDGGHRAMSFPISRRPQVLLERCVGCGLCAQVCPVPGCISLETQAPPSLPAK